MLAYDLYLKNKEYEGNPVKSESPLKKMYVSKSTIEVDDKTKDEYGKDTNPRTEFIQNWLSMPLNTVNADRLNLPDKTTGSRSRQPYLRIFGKLEKGKSYNTFNWFKR